MAVHSDGEDRFSDLSVKVVSTLHAHCRRTEKANLFFTLQLNSSLQAYRGYNNDAVLYDCHG
jgi:hypothetical protein